MASLPTDDDQHLMQQHQLLPDLTTTVNGIDMWASASPTTNRHQQLMHQLQQRQLLLNGMGGGGMWAAAASSTASAGTNHHQQLMQQHQQQLQPDLTTVNGIGMWGQWTRNFSSPVLAFLDLMDNAFDAAAAATETETSSAFTVASASIAPAVATVTQSQQNIDDSDEDFVGHVYVYSDVDPNDDNEDSNTTGIVLTNNTPLFIKPMAQILQIYTSSKGGVANRDGQTNNSIGENGVGLKQGCASLADISFCLSKNLQHYSLGIIAKSLQRNDGCVLPSFTFPNLPSQQDLMDAIVGDSAQQHQKYASVAKCIATYGNGSFEHGIERLALHFEGMSEQEHNGHVFCVVLHHLKHYSDEGAGVHFDDVQSDEDADAVNQDPNRVYRRRVQYAQNAQGLLRELEKELPRRYIHVPSSIHVFVEGKRMAFAYWQHRLVELTVFQIKLDPKHIVHKAGDDWKNPSEGYTLRVYAGFDPIRVNQGTSTEGEQDQKGAPCSLLIYSRQMGRLINEYGDARSLLGLNSSGTEFSQGLTLLVDDVHGNLPLNPTKQDLAFGEQVFGATHRANLFNWLRAIAKIYYKTHLSKFENKQKGLLTLEVKRHYPTVVEMLKSQKTFIPKPLPELILSTFQDINWVLNGANISYRRHCLIQHGEDTVITLDPRAVVSPLPTKGRRPRKKSRATHRGDDSDYDESAPFPGGSKKRAALLDNDNAEPRASRRRFNDVADDDERLLDQELELARLRSQNDKLKQSRDKWKDLCRDAMAKIESLELENDNLKHQQTQRRIRRVASKSTGGKDPSVVLLEGELTAAKARIDELQQTLESAEETAEPAEAKTAVREDIAVESGEDYPAGWCGVDERKGLSL